MDEALKRELIDLETRYWRALQAKDVDTALALTSDPCVVAGAQGVARIDKSAFAALMQSADWTLKTFDIQDVLVEQPAQDVAVVGYKVREALTVQGEPVELEAADASTWVRRDGNWICALHTESLLGDPYGRDRASP